MHFMGSKLKPANTNLFLSSSQLLHRSTVLHSKLHYQLPLLVGSKQPRAVIGGFESCHSNLVRRELHKTKSFGPTQSFLVHTIFRSLDLDLHVPTFTVMHTYIHTYIHACIHTCIHTSLICDSGHLMESMNSCLSAFSSTSVGRLRTDNLKQLWLQVIVRSH